MKSLNVASCNTGCKLGDSLSVETFLKTQTGDEVWDILFISEFCQFSASFQSSPYNIGNVRIVPHYPGAGSHCLAFALKQHVLSSVLDIRWHGRAGCVLIKTCHRRKPLCIVGLHGGHGDALTESLSDVVHVLKYARGRGPRSMSTFCLLLRMILLLMFLVEKHTIVNVGNCCMILLKATILK